MPVAELLNETGWGTDTAHNIGPKLTCAKTWWLSGSLAELGFADQAEALMNSHTAGGNCQGYCSQLTNSLKEESDAT